MGKVDDILFDDSGDDKVLNGDLLIGDATEQNQKALIVIGAGENPIDETSGVGIDDWLLDEFDAEGLKRKIQDEFEADGMSILKLEISGEDIVTKASYGN